MSVLMQCALLLLGRVSAAEFCWWCSTAQETVWEAVRKELPGQTRCALIKSSSSFGGASLCFRDDRKEQKKFWFKTSGFSPGSNWRRFWITGEPEAANPTWQCNTARSEMLIRASGESQTSQTRCHSGISSNRKLLFQGHLGSRHELLVISIIMAAEMMPWQRGAPLHSKAPKAKPTAL